MFNKEVGSIQPVFIYLTGSQYTNLFFFFFKEYSRVYTVSYTKNFGDCYDFLSHTFIE